jgi:hypothetical protein
MSWCERYDWASFGRGEWPYTQVWGLWPTFAEVEELLWGSAPGSWREVVTLPHEEVSYIELMGVPVPSFLPTEAQLERAAWRRRKWWGPVSPTPFHLAAARTWRHPITSYWEARWSSEGGLLDLANDGGVVEPLGWVGDQA